MSKWKASLCIALAALYLSGCAATISSFTDETTRANIVRMSGNRLSGGIWKVELNAQRYEKDGRISYSLIMVYVGPLFLIIEPGKSLTLAIDDKNIEIEGSGSERHRELVSPGLVEEITYYHNLDKELIRNIAYAHRVNVKVQGTKGMMERYFKKKNFSNFKKFYESSG
jgi:hypothetical protein